MTERALSKDEISKIRSKTAEVFGRLEKKDASPRSWINEGEAVQNDQRSDMCHYFDTHGFIKVDGFAGELLLIYLLLAYLFSVLIILQPSQTNSGSAPQANGIVG